LWYRTPFERYIIFKKLLRDCNTSLKVAGSIPSVVIEYFQFEVYYPRVEAGKNISAVIPGTDLVSGETVPADLREG
jgi:hypothetical protein